MTPQEKIEWKKKALELMKAYLTAKWGWPQCTNQQIINELPSFWQLLKDNNMIKPGMTYQNFVQHAYNQYNQASVAEMFRNMGI